MSGTHVYKRFSPSILDPLLVAKEEITPSAIIDVVERNWDNILKPFALPHGLFLQLGEVKGGTNTPKMVVSLLKWRDGNVKECIVMLIGRRSIVDQIAGNSRSYTCKV